ncbi:MAG: hypothetical protein IT167_08120 [Bryobacterales bacterium]|nr:hypothetical protein [Bryobacterales bacterium]
MRILPVPALLLLLSSCAPEPKPTPPPAKQAEAPKPADESRRFPQDNLVETKLVAKELLGKPFMPGGTLARYRKGAREFDMFVGKLPSPTGAALLLLDWKKALTGAKLIPSFGGYFGMDGKRPVFVFSKGNWIAGVAGLPEKEADLQARGLASRLD